MNFTLYLMKDSMCCTNSEILVMPVQIFADFCSSLSIRRIPVIRELVLLYKIPHNGGTVNERQARVCYHVSTMHPLKIDPTSQLA